MNPNYFAIAAAKIRHPEALALLEALQNTAQLLRDCESTLPQRINVNKATRGEASVVLSTSEQNMLAGLAQDQAELEAELSRDFAGMSSAGEIIWALHYGLSADVERSRDLLQHYHADDRALAEEALLLKQKLLGQLGQFLSHFPPG